MAVRLGEAVSHARTTWESGHGKCAMCTTGDIPYRGLHMGKHVCGNADGCFFCKRAGMQIGDQCAYCNRVLMEPET